MYVILCNVYEIKYQNYNEMTMLKILIDKDSIIVYLFTYFQHRISFT